MFFTGPVLAQFGQTQNILTETGPAQDLMKKQLKLLRQAVFAKTAKKWKKRNKNKTKHKKR